MNKNQLLLTSLLVFLLSIVAVNAGTISAIDPTTNDVIRGSAYFLNYTYAGNASSSNITQSMVFIVNGTEFNRLATNGTMNVSANTSDFVTVLMSFNSTAYTERADYAIHINVSFQLGNGTIINDTLVITGVDIDNSNPTATVDSDSLTAEIGTRFIAYCGQSTDGVDTALTTNVSLWKPDGEILSSITNTNSATGTRESSSVEFSNGDLLTEPGDHQLNCRVTDDAGFSVTSSNITILFSSTTKPGKTATIVQKEDEAKSKLGLIVALFGIIIFVVLIFFAIFYLIKKQKRRN